MSKYKEDTIDLIGFKGIILGKDNPSENPLTISEVDEFSKLTRDNKDAEMFSTGYLHGLVAANNNAPVKAERLREVHQATLNYLRTLEYILIKNDEKWPFDNE